MTTKKTNNKKAAQSTTAKTNAVKTSEKASKTNNSVQDETEEKAKIQKRTDAELMNGTTLDKLYLFLKKAVNIAKAHDYKGLFLRVDRNGNDGGVKNPYNKFNSIVKVDGRFWNEDEEGILVKKMVEAAKAARPDLLAKEYTKKVVDFINLLDEVEVQRGGYTKSVNTSVLEDIEF